MQQTMTTTTTTARGTGKHFATWKWYTQYPENRCLHGTQKQNCGRCHVKKHSVQRCEVTVKATNNNSNNNNNNK